MPLNSATFLVFLLAVAGIHFSLPLRFRRAFLLIFSYIFYGHFGPEYITVLLVVTLNSYVCGLRVARAADPKHRKARLAIGVTVNLIVLCLCKYLGTEILPIIGEPLRHILPDMWDSPISFMAPIGISFYTFQATGYLVDVYRRDIEPELSLSRFALFVSFFPNIQSGPIARASSLLLQLQRPTRFDASRTWEGVQLILWGLFKKTVVADRLAQLVNAVYDHAPDHNGPTLIVATYFFAFQIYCDFSGYTDIAIGSARILGYDLPPNFARPYFANTVLDFWRRWHISLSSWLRDYLYISLGGNRVREWRLHLNLMITMVLCGLWHGGSWTFMIWGAYHGVLLCLSRLTLNLRDRLWSTLRVPQPVVQFTRAVITFHLVCLGWMIFRANSVQDIALILRKMTGHWARLFVDPPTMILGAIGIALVLAVNLVQTRVCIRNILARRSAPLRWAVHMFVVFSIILLGVRDGEDFIYFKF